MIAAVPSVASSGMGVGPASRATSRYLKSEAEGLWVAGAAVLSELPAPRDLIAEDV